MINQDSTIGDFMEFVRINGRTGWYNFADCNMYLYNPPKKGVAKLNRVSGILSEQSQECINEVNKVIEISKNESVAVQPDNPKLLPGVIPMSELQ